MIPLSLSELLRLAVQSLSQPKVVMRQVLQFDLGRKQLMQLTLLLVVLDLISALIIEILTPGLVASGKGVSGGVAPFFLLQLFTILGGTILIYFGGKVFGGTGSYTDSFKMVLWLNFVFFLLHFIVPIANMLFPDIANMLFFAIVIAAFVQMTAYVMVLHGFENLYAVIIGIFAAQFVFGILIIIVLKVLGIDLGMEPI